MKHRRLLLPVGFVFVLLLFSYGAVVFYATRKAVYPEWYRPATGVGKDRVLTPCSGYQKAAYIYCGNPTSDFNIDFQSFDFERKLADRTIGASGWLVKTLVPPLRGLVILVHGGGADRRAMLKHLPYLSKAGYDVLLIDCHNQGLALNDGRGVSYGVWESESVLAALDWAHGRNYAAPIIMGTSQGAVAALLAASKSPRGIGAVIAENPYFSARRLLQEVPLIGAVPQIVKDTVLVVLSFWHGYDFNELDARIFAPQVKAPVLLIHGSDDRVVSYQHSRDLMAELKSTKDFWLVPYGDHEIIWNKYREEYEKRVLEFLERYAPHAAGAAASGA